jgi:hypothetical protein
VNWKLASALLLATSLVASDCAACEKCQAGASLEVEGFQSSKSPGIYYGLIRLSDVTGEITLFANGRAKPIIHPAYVRVEQEVDGKWTPIVVILEHFSPGTTMSTVRSGESVEFLVDLTAHVTSDLIDRSKPFRINIKDSAGCSHFSKPFAMPKR